MAQHDYIIANQTFPATRTDINNALSAIVSANSGASAPATTYAYQVWYDTSTNKLKIRNADNDAWIDLFDVDQVADTASPTAPAAADFTNLIRTQLFTASGTYTPATNATKAIVHVVGAGGGGGGTEATSSGEAAAAGGGGAGGVIVSDVIDVSGGSYTSTITIGAAGVGADNTAGTDGGNTSYADGTITLTAGGGSGGTKQNSTNIHSNSSGGTGGGVAAATGHTPILGTRGINGGTGLTFADADISNMVISGDGGSIHPYGGGGASRRKTTSGTSNGANAQGYGAGGSGSISHSNNTDKSGGDGANGVVIVFEYL